MFFRSSDAVANNLGWYARTDTGASLRFKGDIAANLMFYDNMPSPFDPQIVNGIVFDSSRVQHIAFRINITNHPANVTFCCYSFLSNGEILGTYVKTHNVVISPTGDWQIVRIDLANKQSGPGTFTGNRRFRIDIQDSPYSQYASTLIEIDWISLTNNPNWNGYTRHTTDVLWDFTDVPNAASNPCPSDNAINVNSDVVLKWWPGQNSVSHDVYLGTSETAVTSAVSIAGDPAFKQNQPLNNTRYSTSSLIDNTTYYWRIDERNANGDVAIGEVFSFTLPAKYPKPRVIVSTDIGGSDPDDYQSMVHYLVYADLLDTEGLISSPPYAGRKFNILEVIDKYETDYINLVSHSDAFPTPQSLRNVTKQGAIKASPPAGYSVATEGSNWIIQQAMISDWRPLWILVWGSITDVAQAVHDNPTIKNNIRVYSIGNWNTIKDRNARNYLYNNHSDLWWIETDTTFLGMFRGGDQSGDLSNWTFVEHHIRHHGALGDFYFSKKSDIKMGDTPSVLYLLWGNPDTPTTEHWGGMFRTTSHGNNYWTDLTDPQYRQDGDNGARTVNTWREDYLRDWQTRMDWANAAIP